MNTSENTTEKKSWLNPGLLFLLPEAAAGVLLCRSVFLTDLFPNWYTGVLAVVVLAVIGIGIGLLRLRTRTAAAICGVISLAFAACLCVGVYYLQKTEETLQTISVSDTDTKVELNEYALAVLSGSRFQTAEEIADESVGIMGSLDRSTTDQALALAEEKNGTSWTTTEYDGAYELVQALYDEKVQAIFYNTAYYDLITDTFGSFDEDTRILTTYSFETEVKVTAGGLISTGEESHILEGAFTIYLSGIDTYGDIGKKSRSDVNILATVNPKTRTILLVTTPRDYYVPLSLGTDCYDKLTHAGIYGIECSEETLEQLYDIDIDYYVRVNFTGFIDIIDALGGVDVYSENAFTSEVGNYDFVVGTNHVNGKQALGFVRERHSFASGDAQRAKNQMAMIQAVAKKATSAAILTSYDEVLSSVENALQTNISAEDISALIRNQLEDDTDWTIYTCSAEGTGARRTTYSMGNTSLYVTLPDDDSVAEASEKMRQVREGVWEEETTGEEGTTGEEETTGEDESGRTTGTAEPEATSTAEEP